jgi:hypothetical protein
VGKKVAIISVVLLVLGLAILGYYIQQGRKRLLTDPFKAVPPSACFILETVDLQSFMNSLTTGKGLFGEAGKVKEFEGFNGKLKFLADQVNKPGYKKLFDGGTALISFYPAKDGSMNTMLSLTVPGDIRLRHIRDILHSAGIKKVEDSKSDGVSYLMIPYEINSRQDTAFISLVSGLLVCSSSRKLAEEAVSQAAKGDDIRQMPGFSRVHMASGKNEDKIFVVFSNLQDLLKKVLLKERPDMARKITRLAGTSGGDIYINENGIVLSGYTESIDSSDYLYRFKSITPREFHTYKILPSSTVLFETVVIETKSDTKSNNKVSKETEDVAVRLKEYIGDEITRAFIDLRDSPFEENSLIVYELSNRVSAEQAFLEESGQKAEVINFEPDDQMKMPVYKTNFSGLAAILKPGFAPGFSETFVAFYDNFMITGSSYATVTRLLYDNILNKTLGNDLTYKDFESTLPSRAGYFFYCVPSRIISYLSGYLNYDIIEALKSNKGSLNKIQSAGYQLASSNGMIYNSISVRFKDEAREESTTEWETLLDTVAGIKPFFFTNHTTGAKEIFIQDLKNNTYLINAAGRVLWKVPLNERITGNIYMIDYFGNGKYQLLFAGRNYLHILDRNGNYVERYPVKLRSPATNSLAIFDYDNNKNYRLFIAGEDKMVYSYDKTGSVVKGWKPFRTSGWVRSEINYFKVSGKDYLVASDGISVYFLDRNGNKRLNLNEAVVRSRGSAMRLIPGSEPSVICSAPDGTVQQISFDGSVRKFRMKEFSGEHSFDIFDVDGDGFGEYIFIDKGILYLYSHNRSELFSRDFGSEDLGGPINFIFSSTDRKIGVFDVNRKLIFLISKEGKTIEGFPLRGASMFSIGKLSEKSGWHLIVGGTDRFLYNYKIETESK